MKSKILCLKRNCWENIVWTQLLHVPLVLIPKLSPTKVELMTCFHEFSEYESTKFFHQILRNIFLNFIKCSKMRKKTLLANNNFLFLELLLKKFVDSYSRNSWKHVTSSLIECHLDLLTLSQSFVYLEQLVLKNRITKINRKYCAGACLILAGKLNDVKGQSLTHLIEVSKAQFLSFQPSQIFSHQRN